MNINARSDKAKNQTVKVFVRPRPLTKEEKLKGRGSIIRNILRQEISIAIPPGNNQKSFSFDEVFNPDTSQSEVYHVVVSPLIRQIILGYNCTVFAYGQTGSGKTHTMTGQSFSLEQNYNKDHMGLIPRAICHLFGDLQNTPQKFEYTIRVSFMEIYNEDIRDLLKSDSYVPLKVYDDPENKGSVQVRGLSEHTVCTPQEALQWLQFGLLQRHTAPTNLNRESSRSHAVFTILLHTRETTIDGEELIKTGKLHLVDLAGSESVGRSGATGMKATEAGRINMSLLTLGKVIKGLAQKCPHIPYRDSKLTRFLQDSLGGRTKTHMIATISPAAEAIDETLNTIDYAFSARFVYNCPVVNENRKQANIMNHLKDEITSLRKELAATRTGEGFFVDRSNFDRMVTDLEVFKTKESELTKRIEELEEHRRSKEEEFGSIIESFRKTKLHMMEVEADLSEKSSLLEQEKFMSEYYKQREFELCSTAQSLIEVCDHSTKTGEIFHNKYMNLCDQNLSTAHAARNILSTTTNYLNEVENGAKKLFSEQELRYKEIGKNANRLVEINETITSQVEPVLSLEGLPSEIEAGFVDGEFETIRNALENNPVDYDDLELEVIEKESAMDKQLQIYECGITDKISIEDAFLARQKELYSQLTSATKRVIAGYIDSNTVKRKKLERTLDEFVETMKEKFTEIDADVECQWTYLRNLNNDVDKEFLKLHNEYNKPVQELHKTFKEQLMSNPRLRMNREKFESAVSDARKQRGNIEDVIVDAKENVLDYVSQLEDRLKQTTQDKEAVKTVLGSVHSTVTGLHDDVASGIAMHLKHCSEAQQNHLSEIKNFNAKSNVALQKEFQQVKFDVHAGDTPVRQNYRFPRNVGEVKSKEILIKQFKASQQQQQPDEHDTDNKENMEIIDTNYLIDPSNE